MNAEQSSKFCTASSFVAGSRKKKLRNLPAFYQK